MARQYKKKHSFRRSYKRKTPGKRTTLKKTIKAVLYKNTETKYFDVSVENAQVYHNIGYRPVIPILLANVHSDSNFFNPWSDIPAGTGRGHRIGDKITPLSMTINL